MRDGGATATPGHAGGPTDEPGSELRPVRGQWDELIRLFARASPVSMSHWNPATGELFEAPRGKQRAATVLRFEDRLWRDANWIEIPYQESDEAFAAAQEFVADLRAGKAKTQLTAALQGAKPFRAFRTVLAAHPGLQRRWTDLQNQQSAERLVEFCLSQSFLIEDPRFEQALESWLDAREAEEGVEEAPSPPVPVAARRPLGSLSLGRKRGEGES
ncbi:MAG: hypothetical protein HY902_13090 [Deltaproteobacteria bacterium]|nr:hypothetical protein [Deltaproteobacteria bacterium]